MQQRVGRFVLGGCLVAAAVALPTLRHLSHAQHPSRVLERPISLKGALATWDFQIPSDDDYRLELQLDAPSDAAALQRTRCRLGAAPSKDQPVSACSEQPEISLTWRLTPKDASLVLGSDGRNILQDSVPGTAGAPTELVAERGVIHLPLITFTGWGGSGYRLDALEESGLPTLRAANPRLVIERGSAPATEQPWVRVAVWVGAAMLLGAAAFVLFTPSARGTEPA